MGEADKGRIAGSPFDPPSLAFRFGRRFGVATVALADETKVTAEDFLKSSFSDDPATPFFSGQFPLGEVFDLQEKIDHFFGPALIEFLVQVGEFTLEVRVAQSVQTIFKSKICAKTLIRDELVAAEVEGRGLHVRAILGGRDVVDLSSLSTLG